MCESSRAEHIKVIAFFQKTYLETRVTPDQSLNGSHPFRKEMFPIDR